MHRKVIDIFTNKDAGRQPVKSQEKQHTPPEDFGTNRKERKSSTIKRIFVLLVIAGITLYGLRLIYLKNAIEQSTENIETHFRDAKDALSRFDINSAYVAFGEADQEIADTYQSISTEGLFKISLRTIPSIFKDLFQVSKTTLTLAERVAYLTDNAFGLILGNGGDQVIRELESLRGDLIRISKLGSDIQIKGAALGYEGNENATAVDGQIFAVDQFLGALIGWLKGDQNMLVLFQNVSEMRPGGGFVGSYAAATLEGGSLTNLDVRDIYDPDGQLDRRVVPPRPLQGITTYWGARDANWFFDFPISAKKISEFLEASKIYSERNVTFSAVIAVNTNVLSDIVRITGPIRIDEYEKTITHENFLDAIQEEVRSGEDRTTGDPKRIIRVTTPILFERLKNMEGRKKEELLRTIHEHIQKKNIMVFFEDLSIQSFVKNIGAAGDVAMFKEDYIGDYLAVVNANIASGKTDAVIEQHIDVESIIDFEGNVHNIVSISRIHNGDEKSEWWYRSTNKNYIQILTPPEARLVTTTGDDTAPFIPNRDYENAVHDRDLSALENSDIVFEKAVFSTWLLTKPGETSLLEVTYDNPREITFDSNRIPYAFTFDKQSGVQGSITIRIKAPAGYVWESTEKRVMTHTDDNPDRRIQLDLFLVRV